MRPIALTSRLNSTRCSAWSNTTVQIRRRNRCDKDCGYRPSSPAIGAVFACGSMVLYFFGGYFFVPDEKITSKGEEVSGLRKSYDAEGALTAPLALAGWPRARRRSGRAAVSRAPDSRRLCLPPPVG